MAINFSPKVGEILECNFGNYPVSQNGQISTAYYDGRIPPEMIKIGWLSCSTEKLMATHVSSFHYQPLATMTS